MKAYIFCGTKTQAPANQTEDRWSFARRKDFVRRDYFGSNKHKEIIIIKRHKQTNK